MNVISWIGIFLHSHLILLSRVIKLTKLPREIIYGSERIQVSTCSKLISPTERKVYGNFYCSEIDLWSVLLPAILSMSGLCDQLLVINFLLGCLLWQKRSLQCAFWFWDAQTESYPLLSSSRRKQDAEFWTTLQALQVRQWFTDVNYY